MSNVYHPVKTTSPIISDEQLWSKLRLGDQEALSELYKRHINTLCAYGRKFTVDSEVVKDCLQDLFSDLLQRPASVSETASVKQYLMKALRRRLLYHSQKHTYWSLDDQYVLKLTQSIEDQIIEDELVEARKMNVNKVINKLTNRQKEIIYLRYYYSFDNRFIAEIMSLNYQAVCNLMSRTLKTIRGNLIS